MKFTTPKIMALLAATLSANAFGTVYYTEASRSVTGIFFENLTTAIPTSTTTVYLKFKATSISGGDGNWQYTIQNPSNQRISTPGNLVDQPLGASNSLTITLDGTSAGTRFGFNPKSATFLMTDLFICDSASCSSGTVVVDLSENARGLRRVYSIESARLATALNNDCSDFDLRGICLGAGGGYAKGGSIADSSGDGKSMGTLIGGYRYNSKVRLGGWLDANLNNGSVDGVSLSAGEPAIGFFGVWSQKEDGGGYQVRFSAAYGKQDVSVKRTTDNSGTAKLDHQAFALMVSRPYLISSSGTLTPYAGVKYALQKRSSYTETGTDGLSYGNLKDERTVAVFGATMEKPVSPQIVVIGGASIEQKLNLNQGVYTSGENTATAFNDKPRNTIGSVNLGMRYNIDRKSNINAGLIVRQDPNLNTRTTSAMVIYKVGL